jgi:hypothetical protein
MAIIATLSTTSVDNVLPDVGLDGLEQLHADQHQHEDPEDVQDRRSPESALAA